MRLVGSNNEFEGRVEVCMKGVWRRWCEENVAEVALEVGVICRQRLGFIDGKNPIIILRSSSYQILLACKDLDSLVLFSMAQGAAKTSLAILPAVGMNR